MQSVDVLTSLSDTDDIHSIKNSGNGEGLNGCRNGIAAQLDILHHDWVKASILELYMS